MSGNTKEQTWPVHKILHFPLQVSRYSSSIRALNVSNKGSLQVKSYLLQITNLMPKLSTSLITGSLISHVFFGKFIDHFYSWNEALKHEKNLVRFFKMISFWFDIGRDKNGLICLVLLADNIKLVKDSQSDIDRYMTRFNINLIYSWSRRDGLSAAYLL